MCSPTSSVQLATVDSSGESSQQVSTLVVRPSPLVRNGAAHREPTNRANATFDHLLQVPKPTGFVFSDDAAVRMRKETKNVFLARLQQEGHDL